MKSKIGILVIIAVMIFAACEPVENRNTLKGSVTDAEINQYVKIVQEIRDGKKSNFFSFSSEGLKASTSFKHGMGTFVGASSNGFMQCYLVSGPVDISVTILNPDGSKVIKTETFTVEEAFDVAPEWAIFCGAGSKTWTWDDQCPDGAWGNGGYLGNSAPGWWKVFVGEGNLENQITGEGKNATMTFSASGTALTKQRTDGTTDEGTFAFDMSKKKYADGATWSIGQMTTAGITILIGMNPNDNKAPFFTYDILKLTEDEIAFANPESPDTGAWGTAWFWMFKAVK